MITLGTGTLYPYGLERIFDIAKKSGFEGLELMTRQRTDDCAFWDTLDVKYLKQLEKKYDLKIATVHFPHGFQLNPIDWDEVAKLAEDLGVKYVICHIPRTNEPEYQKWFDEYYRKDKGYGFQFLVENVDTGEHSGNAPMIYNEPQEWQKQFPTMCFDVCHALESNQDPIKVAKFLNNIKQFHLSYHDGQSEFNNHNIHQSPLHDKALFKKVFAARKVEFYCIEMYHTAFKDFRDQNGVINTLKEIVDFIGVNS